MFGIVYPAFQSLGMKYIGVKHATQCSWKRVILMVQLKKSAEGKVLIIPSSKPIQMLYF